jgi:hypothetical protein
MNIYSRIGMYLFIVGALLSVVDSMFPPLLASGQGIVYAVLIFTGIFAGLLNVTEDEEHHFLVSAVAFLVVLIAFNQLFAGDSVVMSFSRFLRNGVAFVGSMALAIAIKVILEYGSDDNLVSAREDLEQRSKEIDDWSLSKPMRTWHLTLFVAVALTFLLILLNGPFYQMPAKFQPQIAFLEWLIILVFILDVIVLYRQHRDKRFFWRDCWIDVLAAVPVWGVFGALKAVRLARIARFTHSVKFFSEGSGMNTYLRKRKTRTRPLHIAGHPNMHEQTDEESQEARAEEAEKPEEKPVVETPVAAKAAPAAAAIVEQQAERPAVPSKKAMRKAARTQQAKQPTEETASSIIMSEKPAEASAESLSDTQLPAAQQKRPGFASRFFASLRRPKPVAAKHAETQPAAEPAQTQPAQPQIVPQPVAQLVVQADTIERPQLKPVASEFAITQDAEEADEEAQKPAPKPKQRVVLVATRRQKPVAVVQEEEPEAPEDAEEEKATPPRTAPRAKAPKQAAAPIKASKSLKAKLAKAAEKKVAPAAAQPAPKRPAAPLRKASPPLPVASSRAPAKKAKPAKTPQKKPKR